MFIDYNKYKTKVSPLCMLSLLLQLKRDSRHERLWIECFALVKVEGLGFKTGSFPSSMMMIDIDDNDDGD